MYELVSVVYADGGRPSSPRDRSRRPARVQSRRLSTSPARSPVPKVPGRPRVPKVTGRAATPDGVPPRERQRDAERTRAEIIDVARHEFADRGYAGARVDAIAANTRTTKRMIYFYFGSKEQLYLAVLEQAYGQMRQAEQTVDVDQLDPLSAIRRLAELTFDHQEAYPDFSRLVSIENIDRAEHMAKDPNLARLNTPAIELVARILDAGKRQGIFVPDVDAVDVHMLISAFCTFRLANRHTFRAIFGRDMTDRRLRKHYRQMLGDVVSAYLTSPPVEAPSQARPKRVRH
jgi:AcrR family transcriptional regulator